MEDLLQLSELEDELHQLNANNFRPLTDVKEMLSKLEEVEIEGGLNVKFCSGQLKQTQSKLRDLTDQMDKFQQSFQTMQSWRFHLLASYKQLTAPDRRSFTKSRT